ncbi:MAG: thiolase family protein [Oscillospiraceae bacterium]|nr:thiolase family protein [Oscillospiraceae bacterium]
MDKKNIVIVSACRTPFDRFGGVMRSVPSVELGQYVLEQVVDRVGLAKDQVEYIFYGTAIHAEVAPHVNVPVRQALLKAGFPATTLSMTVDRACCSSMTALMCACREIQAGEIEVAIAAGAENLSNVPHLVSGLRWGKKLGSLDLYDVNAGFSYPGFGPVSVDTDQVAAQHGVTREEMDRWSLGSHQKYAAADADGRFDAEIVPYTCKDEKGREVTVEKDQSPRPDTSYEKLAALRPVYGTQAITAGNSPGLNAGASAVLVMTEEKAKEYGLEVLAYVRDFAAVSSQSQNIPTVPAQVAMKLLERNGMTVEQLDLLEINEAFAAMPLVSAKLMTQGNEAQYAGLLEKTNVNGGAIAIGHPMGATGLRLIMTLAAELRRRGGGRGIACLCGGLAQGDGVLIEVPAK